MRISPRTVLMSLFFAGGAVGGAAVGMSLVRCDEEYHGISSSFRGDVDKMYLDFQNGKIIKRVKLPLPGGCDLEAGVVSEMRNADHGFVALHNPTRDLVLYTEGIMIDNFDDHHLFVTI